MNKEYNNKAVSGPGCSYASLIDYSASHQPGSRYASAPPSSVVESANVKIARDENGRPIYDSAGNNILVTSDNKIIRGPVAQACGNFSSISLAYGM